MSRTRQGSRRPSDALDKVTIRTLAVGYSSGYVIPAHAHDWHQLIYASEGVMSIHTAEGSWVVPSQRAVWVPAGVTHSIEMAGAVSMRTLYIRPRRSLKLPVACRVMDVSPLLRELILHTVSLGMLDEGVASHARLVGVIKDQLHAVPEMPLQLPMPRDPRAQRVALRIRNAPDDNNTLAHASRDSGASVRTLERLFRTETGMTFGRWRQQVRLLHALRLLAGGQSVTSVALDVGYDSTSAFIAAFRSAFGVTPGRYFARG